VAALAISQSIRCFLIRRAVPSFLFQITFLVAGLSAPSASHSISGSQERFGKKHVF